MKKWIGLICILIQGLQYPGFADTPPPGTVKLKGGTDGTTIGNVGDALKVTGSSSVSGTIGVNNFPSTYPVTGTFWQATQPVSGNLGRTWSLLNSFDSITSYQGGAWTVGVNNFPASFNVGNFPSTQAVTGTFWQATQPVSGSVSVSNFPVSQNVNVTNVSIPVTGTFFQATQPVSGTVTANVGTTGGLALNSTLGSPFQAGGSIGNTSFGISGTLPAYASTPTFNLGTLNGAATNATLLNINTTLGSPFQSGGSIGNTSFGISGTLPAYAATPTFNLGTISTASTAANQVAAQTSLSSIDSKLSSVSLQSGSNSFLDKNNTGSLTALNQAVTLTTNGLSTVFFNVTGTFVAVLIFEAQTGDGTWTNVAAINQNNGIFFFVTVPGVNFIVPVGGFQQFRVRVSSYTSGTATITMNGGAGANVVEIFQPVAAANQVTSNGAVTTDQPTYTAGTNAAVSLTTRGGTRSKFVGGDTSQIIRNDYSSVNVTTSAYVQLVASTSANINRLQIFDSSGQDFVLATGGAGSEVDQIQIPPGGWDSPVDLFIPSGSRISIKSKSSTAASGILLITGIK